MHYSNLTAGLKELSFATSLCSSSLGSYIKTFCRIRQAKSVTKSSIIWSNLKPRQGFRWSVSVNSHVSVSIVWINEVRDSKTSPSNRWDTCVRTALHDQKKRSTYLIMSDSGQWRGYLRKRKVQWCYPFVLTKLLTICHPNPGGSWLFAFLLNNPWRISPGWICPALFWTHMNCSICRLQLENSHAS